MGVKRLTAEHVEPPRHQDTEKAGKQKGSGEVFFMSSLNSVSWCLGGRGPLCVLQFALCVLTCSSLACRRPPPLKPYTAYVVNHQSATLAAVNLANFHVTASLPVAPQPERVLERPGARQLYVVSATGKISVAAFPHLHLVSTLDVGKSAEDLAFSPDGRTAYVLDTAD